MQRKTTLWIDIINPSDAFFFGALAQDLTGYRVQVTLRRRAETVDLADSLGMRGTVVGSHHTEAVLKPIAAVNRVVKLNSVVMDFDYGLSFENPLSVTLCKLRRRKSILFCDNDLKLIERKRFLQTADNLVRMRADMLFIPSACAHTMSEFMNRDQLVTYDGYKEDIYIASYKPKPDFLDCLGLDKYVVVRPEAFGSTYVRSERSIVPRLLDLLKRENMHVVYLPRDKNDRAYAKGFDVMIPDRPLNGLDLCYHSDAVLTGSGTMAREAACMGKPAVSFFPNDVLLSVDRKLVDEGRVLHSRSPEEIARFVASLPESAREASLDKSIQVRKQLVDSLTPILNH